MNSKRPDNSTFSRELINIFKEFEIIHHGMQKQWKN